MKVEPEWVSVALAAAALIGTWFGWRSNRNGQKEADARADKRYEEQRTTAAEQHRLQAAVLELQLRTAAKEEDERRRTALSLLIPVTVMLEELAANPAVPNNLRGAILWTDEDAAGLRRTAALLGDRDSAMADAAINLCTELAWLRPAIAAIQAAPSGRARFDQAELEAHINRALNYANAASYHRREPERPTKLFLDGGTPDDGNTR